MGFVSKKPTVAQKMYEANKKMPILFLAIITMAAIGVFVQYDRMTNKGKTRDLRAKAFIQTATGIRIEAEEMTLSGSAAKSSDGTYIQF